jgi:HK97 family phage major capsid protein
MNDIAEGYKRLKDIAADMATLENLEKKTDADVQAYKSLTAEGVALRERVTAWEDGQALKSWMKGSDPNKNVAAKSFGQEVTSEADRDQEQRAMDMAATKAYNSAFESYLRGGMTNVAPSDRKKLQAGSIKSADAMKDLGEAAATGGGFLVPEQFQAEVLKKEPGLAGLNDIVRSQPTTRDVIVWPKAVYTTDDKYTGPQRLTFTGEVPSSSTIARVTDQTFGESRIPVNLAMASQLISNSLIEDGAVDVMSFVAQLFRENIIQDVEYYLNNGTGSGQPEGLFINSNAQTNYVPSGGAATLTSDGLVNLYWKTPAQYRRNGKFVMSSDTARQIGLLKDANGRYIWQSSDMFGGGLNSVQQDGSVVVQPRFLGMPLVITEHAPTITTNSFSASFGDHRGYIKPERVGMTIRVLDELYAETDKKLFLLRMRFGGQLAEDYKVRLLKIAAT